MIVRNPFQKLKSYIRNITSRKNSKYETAEIISETYKAIIACSKCKQKLRVPVSQNKRLHITCQKCGSSFLFDSNRYKLKIKFKNWLRVILYSSAFIIVLATPFITIFYLKIAPIRIRDSYEAKIKKRHENFLKEAKILKIKYNSEIAKVNSAELNIKAKQHYKAIWEERKNFNSKYAITPREKAQLEMLTLSKDKTRGIEEIIKNIAVMAAPRNSTINVDVLSSGYRLGIDFDMSELSPGEEGARTKYDTVDSLKRGVIRLISKVTNDMYQFCQDLDLESIAIGCRHYVEYGNDSEVVPSEKNIVIYKVRLDRKDLKELKDNPFLDTYSTTKFFKVEKDDFPNLKIKITKN